MKNAYSPSMKLAALIDKSHDLIGLLSRVGLKFGFGEDTVEEACRKHGVDTATFLLICKVYDSESYVPTQADLASASLKDIIKYLRLSHKYYTGYALTSLSTALDEILKPCAEKPRQVILSFFRQYRDELRKHFEYEESVVFPYVDSLLAGQRKGSLKIGQFEENHSNIEEKISDLKNIVMKYLPEACDSSLTSFTLFNIYHLEADLAKHTSIEDDILIPIVKTLESDGNE